MSGYHWLLIGAVAVVLAAGYLNADAEPQKPRKPTPPPPPEPATTTPPKNKGGRPKGSKTKKRQPVTPPPEPAKPEG